MVAESSEDRIKKIQQFLRKKMSVKPEHIKFYDEAFRDKSCGDFNNLRLAFLGDRVFDLLVVEHTLSRQPPVNKKLWESERQKIHRSDIQANIAREMDLLEPMAFGEVHMNTDKKVLEKSDWRMERALEALFAAIFLDLGFGKAREVADRWVL